jgi:DNA modification methylase
MAVEPYYQDASVKIYHGRCEDVLPYLEDVGGIVTDPPYGVGYDYGDEYHDITGDAYWAQMDAWLAAMRAAAPSVVFTHRVSALRHLEGWDWVSIWNKPNAMSGLNSLPVMPHWEPIFMYGVKMRTDLKRRFDVISVNPANARESEHPCPKPIALMSELINWTVPAGGIVVDPFAGSGVNQRAAQELGRKAIGIEQSERYCEIAAERCGGPVRAVLGGFDFGGAA